MSMVSPFLWNTAYNTPPPALPRPGCESSPGQIRGGVQIVTVAVAHRQSTCLSVIHVCPADIHISPVRLPTRVMRYLPQRCTGQLGSASVWRCAWEWGRLGSHGSHGNGCKISHGIGMGWEWELRRGSCHQQL